MSDYEEKEEDVGEMFGMSIKDDDELLDIDPLADDALVEEDEDPLLEEEEVGLFLEDGDEEESY